MALDMYIQPHSDSKKMTQLNRLNATLQLPIGSEKENYRLGWLDRPEGLSQLAVFSPNSGPVSIDFVQGKKAHRRQFGGGKNQPLARALGMKKGHTPSIIDATAGMAGDAFVMASLGSEVFMIERSPVISALIEDALSRGLEEGDADTQSILSRMHLKNADATQYLQAHPQSAQVIYLDPMYPEKKKRSAVKKEMQLLQALVGPDIDSSLLLEAALTSATERVVVKRPAKAPPVPTRSRVLPSVNIQSPNTRYDVYVIKALKYDSARD